MPPRPLVIASEMHTVGAEHQGRLEVIVDDERHVVTRAETAGRTPSLDDVHARMSLSRHCTTVARLDRNPGGLEGSTSACSFT